MLINKLYDKHYTDDLLLTIQVEGAVENPGEYSVEYGVSLEEFIFNELILKEDAALEKLFIDQIITTNIKIIIPYTKNSKNLKVDINKATLEELIEIPYIGEKKAIDIINYRNENIFRNIEELTNIKGIGPKTFEKIKEYITI